MIIHVQRQVKVDFVHNVLQMRVARGNHALRGGSW